MAGVRSDAAGNGEYSTRGVKDLKFLEDAPMDHFAASAVNGWMPIASIPGAGDLS